MKIEYVDKSFREIDDQSDGGGGGGGLGRFWLAIIFFFMAACLCKNVFFLVQPFVRIFFS